MAGVIIPLILVLAASCGGQQPADAPSAAQVAPSPAASAVNAGKLYSENCAVCHGASRQGTPNLAPPLTRDALARLNDAQLREVIAQGKANTSMTGFEGRLSAAGIDALAGLMRE